MINGCLVGMVSICAGADSFYPWSAGVIAGKLNIYLLNKSVG